VIPIAGLPITVLLWPMTAEVWPALPAVAVAHLQVFDDALRMPPCQGLTRCTSWVAMTLGGFPSSRLSEAAGRKIAKRDERGEEVV
jgi:hypothetical protein